MKKKLLALAMLGIMSLTAIGFGYAKWSSTVDASVTVNTGSVLIGIRDVGTDDDGSNVGVPDVTAQIQANPGQPSGADPQWGEGINGELKDVATKISTNTGNAIGSIGSNAYYGSISETITNAYPYYGPTSVIEIANLGTIPVKIETLDWAWDPTSVINDEYYDIVSWTISYPGASPITGSGTANLLASLAKIQLHADDVLTLTMQEGIRQTNKAETVTTPQSASGTATLTVTASQWNEVQ